MSGLSDAAHFGLKDRSEATQQQYLNFLFDDAQILSFFISVLSYPKRNK